MVLIENKTPTVLLLEKESLKEFKQVDIQSSKGFKVEVLTEDIEYIEIYLSKLVVLKKISGEIKIYSDPDLYFRK